MIQLNLLPDIKIAYIKAARTKRLVISISVIVMAVVLVVVSLIASAVLIFQKQHIANLDRDINQRIKNIEETEDVDRILTVQNQLNSLTGLHEQKPAATRMFDFIAQMTPSTVSLSDLTVNFAENSITIEGESESLASINQFVDTIKFTNFTVITRVENDLGEEIDNESEPERAFGQVVLADFSRSEEKFSYEIVFTYNPVIFENPQNINLITTQQITTRSELDEGSNIPIFNGPTQTTEEEIGGVQ